MFGRRNPSETLFMRSALMFIDNERGNSPSTAQITSQQRPPTLNTLTINRAIFNTTTIRPRHSDKARSVPPRPRTHPLPQSNIYSHRRSHMDILIEFQLVKVIRRIVPSDRDQHSLDKLD